jgi:hypothetical protein
VNFSGFYSTLSARHEKGRKKREQKGGKKGMEKGDCEQPY